MTVVIDRLEKLLNQAYKLLQSQRPVVKAFVGYALVLYGNSFLGVILLLQGIKVVGTKSIEKSLNDLYETYCRTRNAVKDALPDVEYIISQRQKFEKAIADYQKGAIKPEDFDRISKEMSELEDLVKRSESSFQSVVTAVDPENLSETTKQLYLSMLSFTAVATSTYAATITQGINIGHVIGDRLFNLMKELQLLWKKYKSSQKPTSGAPGSTAGAGAGTVQVSPETAKKLDEWLRTIVHVVSQGIGLTVAYTMQAASITFSGCVLGSEFILESFEDLVDPQLRRAKLPTLVDNASAVAVVQGALITLGFLSQQLKWFGPQQGGIPQLGKILFAPLIMVENFVQVYVLTRLATKQ